MTQTEYEPPDWGALLISIDEAMADAGPISDVVSYTIAGRTFTKSRAQILDYRQFVLDQYNLAVAGSSETLIDRRGEC